MRNETKDALLRDETIIKSQVGNYIIYNRKWLLKHLDEEYDLLKGARDNPGIPITSFTKEDFANWMKQIDKLTINDDE